ncbi:hypothetical protein Leryth_013242 [Lithospermum erythrorhizon]|nr:hypothetical protein Leryth_013242 [Lithospermum erythrorhizon]
MENNSRKWMVLAATIFIQAFTGTNFDFSAYSCVLKYALGLSQVQLNYLATASDFGKALGWCSGLALQRLPVWVVLFISAFMGFLGYGLQWLVVHNVVLLCFMDGVSICWFNTVCFVLCSRNFPSSRPLALALSVSFNGLSAALYNLMADALNPSSRAFYLVLNALVPILISVFALFPILCQSPEDPPTVDSVKRDQPIFIALNILAVITGLYLLLLHSTNSFSSCMILFGTICLLILNFGIPHFLTPSRGFHNTIYSMFNGKSSGFTLPDTTEDLDLQQELLKGEHASRDLTSPRKYGERSPYGCLEEDSRTSQRGCDSLLGKDRLFSINEEHKPHALVRSLDFWLYYAAYFCGGTIGLVYSNNLGQISESLGLNSMTTTLITLYSSFSFFGRLLAAGPDFIKNKVCFARTGWMAIMLLPTPLAFFLLASSSSAMVLKLGTSLIGLSSGFLFAGAVSITSELFGPNSVGVNHNILITNIPIGSLVYGFLAATVYDGNGSPGLVSTSSPIVCIGKECYFTTFLWWGFIAILGVASSFLLFFRTRHAYYRYEQNQM